MKAVSLTDRIKYFHCDGAECEGVTHGVMVLLGANGKPTKTAPIEDQSEFKFWYRNFSAAEHA